MSRTLVFATLLLPTQLVNKMRGFMSHRMIRLREQIHVLDDNTQSHARSSVYIYVNQVREKHGKP